MWTLTPRLDEGPFDHSDGQNLPEVHSFPTRNPDRCHARRDCVSGTLGRLGSLAPYRIRPTHRPPSLHGGHSVVSRETEPRDYEMSSRREGVIFPSTQTDDRDHLWLEIPVPCGLSTQGSATDLQKDNAWVGTGIKEREEEGTRHGVLRLDTPHVVPRNPERPKTNPSRNSSVSSSDLPPPLSQKDEGRGKDIRQGTTLSVD